MPFNAHIEETTLAEKELAERVSWFIQLRWFAVAGISATSLFARAVLKIDVPLTPIAIIACCILFFNCFCLSFQRRAKSQQRFTHAQIVADWIALIFLSHYTGGIESPLIFYFIFHVIIAAILLSRRGCYLQITCAFVFLSCLSILEYNKSIPHISIKALFANPVYNNGHYLVSMLFFFATSLYASGYLATTIAHHLRKREAEAVVLKNTIADAYTKLEAMDKEKTAFTYKVTHELRAPLGAIQSLLKSIEEGYAGDVPAKAKELIIRSEKRTKALLVLINDLLDLVSGKINKERKGEMKRVDGNDAIKNTIHLLQEKAKEKGVNIITNTTSKPLQLTIAPDDLELILTNLIDNAVKYTKKGGTATVNTAIGEGAVKIEISDTGIGIHKEDLHKVFDEFYRGSNAKALETNGTGLGLSIVRNLINRYGGNIDVKSELGNGTTFTVSFPTKELTK
ncbi:MAG: HAMP domain-containing histidine kinase [Candidatus Brocadiaceae bacterium]|nr:HAMP domain-containing histidine kinase [Candidatus Brocadiaceae bacterium]